MKFFSCFCSCYQPEKVVSGPPQEEEASASSTGFLLLGAKTRTTGGHARSSNGSSASHWQPVLSAISEEESTMVVPLIANRESGKTKKRTSGSKDHNIPKAKARSYWTHSDDTYFDRQAKMVAPVYLPAPMMF